MEAIDLMGVLISRGNLNTYSTFVFESNIVILFYWLLNFKTLDSIAPILLNTIPSINSTKTKDSVKRV